MTERIALLAIGLAALASACGAGRSEPVGVRAGDLAIAASVSPPELRVGRNELWIELADAQGAPVADADVEVKVTMPAMGAMRLRITDALRRA